MFCTKCGNEIQEGASFCPNCGKPVNDVSAGAADNLTKEVDISNENYIQNTFVQNEVVKGVGNKQKNIFMWIGIAAFVVAIIAFFCGKHLVPALVLAILAIVVAIIALVKKGKLKGFPIAAIVIGVITLFLSIATFGMITKDDIVGTYVGLNGSGLILHKDGSVDYYYEDWLNFLEVNDTWSYDNGKVLLKLSWCEPYAYIRNKKADEIEFVTDDSLWDDEVFIKITSKEQSLSNSEFDELITIGDNKKKLKKTINEIYKNDRSRETKADNAVTPEFKKLMDGYEEFFNDYVDFMKNYNNSTDALSMLSDYMEFLTKYAEMISDIEAIDTDSLSLADLAYYMEVYGRIMKKIAEVAS